LIVIISLPLLNPLPSYFISSPFLKGRGRKKEGDGD